MTSEIKNGKYPTMQNPGDPGSGFIELFKKKHVLIINGAVIANPNGFDEKVMLYQNGSKPATEEDEVQAILDTTQ